MLPTTPSLVNPRLVVRPEQARIKQKTRHFSPNPAGRRLPKRTLSDLEAGIWASGLGVAAWQTNDAPPSAAFSLSTAIRAAARRQGDRGTTAADSGREGASPRGSPPFAFDPPSRAAASGGVFSRAAAPLGTSFCRSGPDGRHSTEQAGSQRVVPMSAPNPRVRFGKDILHTSMPSAALMVTGSGAARSSPTGSSRLCSDPTSVS